MVKDQSLSKIIDDAVRDISLKVACLDVDSTQEVNISFAHPVSLVVAVRGDYEMQIILQTDKYVLSKISENMKRQIIEDDNDIAIYATEYFNILCGHIVASYNRSYHMKTRFSVPKMWEVSYDNKGMYQGGILHQLNYECNYGFLRLQVTLKDYHCE